MKSRVILIFLCLVACWGVLLARGVSLQVLENERLEKLKNRQFSKQINIPGRRGAIYDRHGKALALSTTTYSLFADPKLITEPKRVATQLKRKLKLPWTKTYRRLIRRGRFVWLRRGLSKEQRDEIRALKVRGLGFIEEPKRVYPNGTLASQVLGSVGRDNRGLEGIERQYDELLQGKQKKVSMLRDAWGRPLIATGDWLDPDLNGKDLVLTVDRDLQFFVERELQKAVEKNDADSAVAVVLEAQTSEVLAMANYPSYNPKDRRSKGWSPWSKNRTVTDAFEPGSTLKTILLASALRHEMVTPNKRYFCENGRFKIGRRTIREADSRHHYGWLTVDEILSKSSNIGTSKVALELGDERYRHTLEWLGFGQRTGIDFPGEAKGIMHGLPWRDHLLANVSFGHGISSTPIQLASAYATVARGGVWRTPRLLKEVRNGLGDQVKSESIPSKTDLWSRRVLDRKVSQQLTMMLTSATSETGTGIKARVPGFLVAGKTGTAQKVDPNGRGYLPGAYISSFAGFVPAHQPKFVIYVALDNPKSAYYASSVAAPVFSSIASFGIRKSGLMPEIIDHQNLLANQREGLDEKVTQALSRLQEVSSSQLQHVPDLEGLTLREVHRRLREQKLPFSVTGRGLVMKTTPPVGSPIHPKTHLKIELGDER